MFLVCFWLIGFSVWEKVFLRESKKEMVVDSLLRPPPCHMTLTIKSYHFLSRSFYCIESRPQSAKQALLLFPFKSRTTWRLTKIGANTRTLKTDTKLQKRKSFFLRKWDFSSVLPSSSLLILFWQFRPLETPGENQVGKKARGRLLSDRVCVLSSSPPQH